MSFCTTQKTRFDIIQMSLFESGILCIQLL